MTTVSELIEYLKDIPLDTELRVLDLGIGTHIPLDIDKFNGNVDYTDFGQNGLVTDHSDLFDRRFLDFGEV